MNNPQTQFKRFSFPLRVIRQLYADGILPHSSFEEVYSYIYAGDTPLGSRDRRRSPDGNWYTESEFNRWWGPAEGPEMWRNSSGPYDKVTPHVDVVDAETHHVIDILNPPPPYQETTVGGNEEDAEVDAAKGLFSLSLEAAKSHQPVSAGEVDDEENVVLDMPPEPVVALEAKETIRLLKGVDGKGMRGTWLNKKTNQNGLLRVGINNETHKVRKLKPKAWTDDANALFEILYPSAVALDKTRSERRALTLAHYQSQGQVGEHTVIDVTVGADWVDQHVATLSF